MKQKTFLRILTAVVSTALLTPSVTAKSTPDVLLSPALSVIAQDCTMMKTGIIGTGVKFNADDFSDAVGISSVSKITVTSLPDSDHGILKLGSQAVKVGQTVAKRNLSALSYTSYDMTESKADFTFTVGNDCPSYRCIVYTLDHINTPPVITKPESVGVGVFAGCDALGSLSVYDADGDSYRFEILSAPTKGTLTFTDHTNGYYIYHPYADSTGRDSFTVRAVDEYGGCSDSVKVTVDIDHAAESEVYADMGSHWANSALIVCARNHLLDGTLEVGNTEGAKLFYPEEAVSRAEFLSVMMAAAGYDGFRCENTGFADDDDIPEIYKGSIAAAEALGIVKGIETENGVCFCPNSQITRAEAAVITARLLGLDSGSIAVSEDDSMPVWAVSAMTALYDAGLLRSLSPYTTVTRAVAVQIAANVLHFG